MDIARYKNGDTVIIKRWKEVYCTSEVAKFMSAKNILTEQNTKYKTKIVNNNLRVSLNSIVSGTGGRTDGISKECNGIKDFYKISVKEQDEDHAFFGYRN